MQASKIGRDFKAIVGKGGYNIQDTKNGKVGFYLNYGVLMRKGAHAVNDNEEEVVNDTLEERVQVVVPTIFRE